MSDFNASTRTLLQATYTPVDLPQDDATDPQDAALVSGQAMSKLILIRSLKPSREEIDQVAETAVPTGDAVKQDLINLARSIIADGAPGSEFEIMPALANVPPETCSWFARSLISVRSETSETMATRFAELMRDHKTAMQDQDAPSVPGGETPGDHSSDPLPSEPAPIDIPSIAFPVASPVSALIEDGLIHSTPTAPLTLSTLIGSPRGLLQTSNSIPGSMVLSSSTTGAFIGALNWASTQPTLAEEVAGLTARFTPVELLRLDGASDMPRQLSQIIVQPAKVALQAFEAGIRINPVGYLHLEKLNFTPVGSVPGELLYTIPLTPEEEVNISHREWSNTAEELQDIVTDYLETYSEEGVTEKTELAQSTTTQRQHANALNLSVSASGSYGPVSISSSLGYSTTRSFNQSEREARTSSRDMVRQATSRVKREHKVSFKIAEKSGESEETSRKIRNPHKDKGLRVDYFQMLRKWQVNLVRYGVRLTYDITIPEPGSDLLAKIEQKKRLEEFQAFPFVFPVAPEDIKEYEKPSKGRYWRDLANQFGAESVPPPPQQSIKRVSQISKTWQREDETRKEDIVYAEFTIPRGYSAVIFGVENEAIAAHDVPDQLNNKRIRENGQINRTNFNIASLKAAYSTGHRSILDLTEDTQVKAGFRVFFVQRVSVTVSLEFQRSDELFREWQYKVWETLKDAAQRQFDERKAAIAAAIETIEEEISEYDPLGLRKMEREEVTKNVLRWLIGPDFDFLRDRLPSSTATLYDAKTSGVEEATYGRVMSYGAIIKFLHHAIEWENMVYVLYPYFWTDPTRWQDKLYLDHPDMLHEAFLKAGAARVVLPIRPGFEKRFSDFVDNGGLGMLSAEEFLRDGTYVSIAEEMRNFAQTNYPGVPSPNPSQNVRTIITLKQKRAWEQIQALIAALESFKAQHGRYPSTQEGIAALDPFAGQHGLPPLSTLKDPWNKDYVYRSPGLYGDYDLASWGANEQEGPEFDPKTNEVLVETADITSWAEGSVIDSWYEFTPTSALDMGIATIPLSGI